MTTWSFGPPKSSCGDAFDSATERLPTDVLTTPLGSATHPAVCFDDDFDDLTADLPDGLVDLLVGRWCDLIEERDGTVGGIVTVVFDGSDSDRDRDY